MPEMTFTSKYSPVGWKTVSTQEATRCDIIGLSGDMVYQFIYDETERAYIVERGSVKKITDPSIVIPSGGAFSIYLASWRHQLSHLTKYIVNTVTYYNTIRPIPINRDYTFKQYLTSPPTIKTSGTVNNLLHSSGIDVATYLCHDGTTLLIHTVDRNTHVPVCDFYTATSATDAYTPTDHIIDTNLTTNGKFWPYTLSTSWGTGKMNTISGWQSKRYTINSDAVITPLDITTHTRKIVRPIIRPIESGTTGWFPQYGIEVGKTYYELITYPATWLLIDTDLYCHNYGATIFTPIWNIGPYSYWQFYVPKVSNINYTDYATNLYMTQSSYLLINANNDDLTLYSPPYSYFSMSHEPIDNAPTLAWNFYFPGFGPGSVTTASCNCYKDGFATDTSNRIVGTVSNASATPVKSYAHVATYYETSTATTTRTRMSLIMSDGIIYADSENLYSGEHQVSKIPFKIRYPDGELTNLSISFTDVIDISSFGLFDYSLIRNGAQVATDANGLLQLL